MKIMLICGALPPDRCGVGDYTNELANALSEAGHEVVVYSSVGKMSSGQYKVIPNAYKWTDLKTIKDIKSVINTEKFDVIHVEWPFWGLNRESVFSCILLPVNLRKVSKRLIYTFHEYSGLGIKRMIRKVECFFPIILSDALIVVEPYFKQEIAKFYGYKNIYFSQIHTNVCQSEKNMCELNEVRKRICDKFYGFSEEKIISFFGFVSSNKKIELIIEAFRLLKEEGKLQSRLIICGELFSNHSSLQTYQDMIKKMLVDYDLSNYVCDTGYLMPEEVGDYLKATDFSIMLYEEGASVRHGACLAALQEGNAVITTRPSDGYKFEFDGIDERQIIFVDNNARQIADAILDMQTNSVKYDVKKGIFSSRSTASDHINIYKEVLNEKG